MIKPIDNSSASEIGVVQQKQARWLYTKWGKKNVSFIYSVGCTFTIFMHTWQLRLHHHPYVLLEFRSHPLPWLNLVTSHGSLWIFRIYIICSLFPSPEYLHENPPFIRLSVRISATQNAENLQTEVLPPLFM